MRPLANFLCKKCGQLKGELPVKHEDLPIDSVRCPFCGAKRGFSRLFDSIGGVMTGNTRNTDRLLNDTMQPLYNEHSSRKQSAQSFERAASEAIDRSIHEATPQQRATAKPFQPSVMPAAAALGGIPAAGKLASRELAYPALTMKKVQPQWERTKGRS